ncbi:hypothetical protein KDK_51620 [Dictyobacter kobayashii]|uniref:Uncharacterized protein n=1 Tax=Dictyobacter kobayashii TaxID=2014872 RepID=A0A402AQI8_9CHLR|nr:hypothetical protein KDK_51620 [Dictyobacter kobayashii]
MVQVTGWSSSEDDDERGNKAPDLERWVIRAQQGMRKPLMSCIDTIAILSIFI